MSEKEFIKEYDVTKYFRPSVTVDTIVFTIKNEETDNYRKIPEKKLQVMLGRRTEHPFQNKWEFPGTFVGEKEKFEEAVDRCLKEKANIKDLYLEQLYTWADPERDPRTRVISASYMGLVDKSKIHLKAGNRLEEIGWFDISLDTLRETTKEEKWGKKQTEDIQITLTNGDTLLKSKVRVIREMRENNIVIYTQILDSELAFDHAKLLIYAIERLKNKVQYTTIAFNLMKEEFTLTELQQVYEVLLNKPLLKANFRRKIADMVTETEHYQENGGHRPSKLFRFNKGYWPHIF